MSAPTRTGHLIVCAVAGVLAVVAWYSGGSAAQTSSDIISIDVGPLVRWTVAPVLAIYVVVAAIGYAWRKPASAWRTIGLHAIALVLAVLAWTATVTMLATKEKSTRASREADIDAKKRALRGVVTLERWHATETRFDVRLTTRAAGEFEVLVGGCTEGDAQVVSNLEDHHGQRVALAVGDHRDLTIALHRREPGVPTGWFVEISGMDGEAVLTQQIYSISPCHGGQSSDGGPIYLQLPLPSEP
jgi:hypothetical protein